MSMYHIAKTEFNDGDVLKTNVPLTTVKEEGDIPRICVTNHPLKCMLALHPIYDTCKVYTKVYTALYSWLYDKWLHGNPAIKKNLKDTFEVYKAKFPHSNVTMIHDSSGTNHAVFKYKSISISEIKSLIRLFKQYCWSVKFIREDEEKYFRFYIIRNVQLLKVTEKSYLPPNASDFRRFGERWILHDTKNYKILGRIDMVPLFKDHVMRLTDKKYTIIHDFPERKLCMYSKVKYEI